MSTALRFSAPAGSSWLPWIVSTGRPTFRLGSAKLTRLRAIMGEGGRRRARPGAAVTAAAAVALRSRAARRQALRPPRLPALASARQRQRKLTPC